MMGEFPVIYLASHGETAWTLTGQYHSFTDLPLTDAGESDARALKRRLHRLKFAKVLTSPLQRVSRTCELAGFGEVAEIDSDLEEWNYGEYEGLTDEEINALNPDWYLFRDGCPHGESPGQVAARADQVITCLRDINDDVLIFSSVQFLRAFAARWLGVRLSINARRLVLDTSSLSAVGYEHSLIRPVIRLWNDTRHAPRGQGAKNVATS